MHIGLEFLLISCTQTKLNIGQIRKHKQKYYLGTVIPSSHRCKFFFCFVLSASRVFAEPILLHALWSLPSCTSLPTIYTYNCTNNTYNEHMHTKYIHIIVEIIHTMSTCTQTLYSPWEPLSSMSHIHPVTWGIESRSGLLLFFGAFFFLLYCS